MKPTALLVNTSRAGLIQAGALAAALRTGRGLRRSKMTGLPLTGGAPAAPSDSRSRRRSWGASYCHCKRCQRRSGTAASANAHPADGGVRIVAGEDRLRAWRPADGGEKWFCGDCGSSLFGRNPAHADPIGILIGAFDGDPGVPPSARQFVRYAAPWEREAIPDDDLPRHPESRHAAT